VSPAPATAPKRRTTAPVRGRGLSSVVAPRRVSGPASGRRPVAPAPRRRPPGLLTALARGAARVSRHPLVDRVIGGRWSIVVIAFALIGIVTLQLGLLKLNVGVGRSLERERTLERENATLGIENAELASPERIHELARRLGMSSVALTQLRFLRAAHDRSAAAGAAARLRSPVHPATPAGSEASSGEGSAAEASGSEASSTEASSGEVSSGEASSGEASSAASSTETASSEASSAEASSPSGGESQGAAAGGGEAEASSGGSAETGEGG